MAAILCRVCFVEPCKAMAKCCESCCQCLGSCCDCFGKCIASCCQGFENCCNYISGACDTPFSGCLFTAVTMNLVVLIYSIIAILSGGNQCNKPLLILAILLLVCGIINALFSYYMYHTINHDAQNPLFKQNATSMSPSAKLYAFFKYDKWMAAYIIFVMVLIALLIVSITMASSCSSDISKSVFWIAVLLFIYLGVAILILFSYVAFDMFKEWSNYCWCWLLPFCWPCLIIGCCLKTADGYSESVGGADKNYPGNKYVAPPEQKQVIQSAAAPVVVVQQPPIQQVVYAQPVQPQQVVYTQPQNVQQPAYNPAAAAPVAQPGVFVAHAAPVSNIQHYDTNKPQAQHAQAEKKVDDGDSNEIKDKSVKAAKAAGTQAKKAGVAALGWMTKKMNEMNDKAQEGNQNKANGEGQEGNAASHKTY